MIKIELNSEETDMLHLILESYLSDLRMDRIVFVGFRYTVIPV